MGSNCLIRHRLLLRREQLRGRRLRLCVPERVRGGVVPVHCLVCKCGLLHGHLLLRSSSLRRLLLLQQSSLLRSESSLRYGRLLSGGLGRRPHVCCWTRSKRRLG